MEQRADRWRNHTGSGGHLGFVAGVTDSLRTRGPGFQEHNLSTGEKEMNEHQGVNLKFQSNEIDGMPKCETYSLVRAAIAEDPAANRERERDNKQFTDDENTSIHPSPTEPFRRREHTISGNDASDSGT